MMATPEQAFENAFQADLRFLLHRYPCLGVNRMADPVSFDAQYRKGFAAMCRWQGHLGGRRRAAQHFTPPRDYPEPEGAASVKSQGESGQVSPDWGAQYKFLPPQQKRRIIQLPTPGRPVGPPSPGGVNLIG